MERNKGKIITVTSTKGGVGKTITTLNLAGVFSNLKKKVLVIDFDLYGGAVATYLNSKNSANFATNIIYIIVGKMDWGEYILHSNSDQPEKIKNRIKKRNSKDIQQAKRSNRNNIPALFHQ